LIVTITPGTNPASTGIAVTGNLAPIGGGASQQFYDDGTHGDVTAGDNRFSYQTPVSSGVSAGAKTISINIIDTQGRPSSTSIPLTVTAPADPPTDASARVIFPHIADGGGYRTVLLLTNGNSASTTATVSFFSTTGTPLTVTAGGTTASSFVVQIQAGGSAKITTAGLPANPVTGWAMVTTEPSVGLNGNAIFQLFNGSTLFCEASVPAVLPATSQEFFADEDGGFNTGVAWANPGNITATGTLTLRNTSGLSAGTYPISVPPGHQAAAFLWQIFSGAPSGRAEVSLTAGSLSMTALRFHSSSVFSTVSVGCPGGSSTPVALFSPSGRIRARIISEINKATSKIDIAIYSFTADEIREALVAAKGRGVAIRIIADTSQANGQGSEIATLEGLGFNLKRSAGGSGGIMHNKYMIIDERVLFTGSYNWSANAEDSNFENAIFLLGSPVTQSYISDFEKIWGR
jgi:hypothetical protein